MRLFICFPKLLAVFSDLLKDLVFPNSGSSSRFLLLSCFWPKGMREVAVAGYIFFSNYRIKERLNKEGLKAYELGTSATSSSSASR